MPRPLWNGAISFGLVTIPVRLYNAVSRRTVSFNQIDRRTSSRIKLKRVSALDGSDVADADIVKGYEVAPGRYVEIEQAELDALDPQAARTIEIEAFVDLAEIDPIYYDSAYYLAPDKATAKPYALLLDAMRQSNKVGIARFVMRQKQYLAAIRVQDDHLVLSTMVYADEIVPADGIAELEALGGVEVSDREVAMARQLIESLAEPFDPDRYEDTHRRAVLAMIERKAAGGITEVEAPAVERASSVVDLMAALEASVAEAKVARGRHPTGRTVAGAGEEPKKRAPRKRKSA